MIKLKISTPAFQGSQYNRVIEDFPLLGHPDFFLVRPVLITHIGTVQYDKMSCA